MLVIQISTVIYTKMRLYIIDPRALDILVVRPEMLIPFRSRACTVLERLERGPLELPGRPSSGPGSCFARPDRGS